MKIVVQKYGGTSVATDAQRQIIADRVQRSVKEGYGVVVVVSAMGRKGDPYATDTLLDVVHDYRDFVQERDLDLLMSCGEIISAVNVGGVLRSVGLPVTVLTGGQAGIKTTSDFTQAKIINVQAERVLKALREGQVVVVAGFQGSDQRGEITTLGRGGSDTTAAALGVALAAERVEIFTDVAGVMTADPRIEPEAKVLQEMTYQELLQMAQKGAKVIHPRAVELAMQNSLPLYVAKPQSEEVGTSIIEHKRECSRYETGHVRPVTAVAHLSGLIQLQIQQMEPALAREFYNLIAQEAVSLDLINIGEKSHVFVIDEKDLEAAQKVCQVLNINPIIVTGVSKVSCIGIGMHGIPGVLAQIVQTLTDAGINILQTSDSHLTISCLVKASDVATAVKALHKHFCLKEVT